jgi:hypothetical protein
MAKKVLVKLDLELQKEIEVEEGQEVEDVIYDEGLCAIRDQGVEGWEVIDDNYQVVSE